MLLDHACLRSQKFLGLVLNLLILSWTGACGTNQEQRGTGEPQAMTTETVATTGTAGVPEAPPMLTSETAAFRDVLMTTRPAAAQTGAAPASETIDAKMIGEPETLVQVATTETKVQEEPVEESRPVYKVGKRILVAQGTDFKLKGGRYEKQYNWIILFGPSTQATLPVKKLAPGKYEVAVFGMNAKPAPIIVQVENGDDPSTKSAGAATVSFVKADRSFTTETAVLETQKTIRNLRVRFINDAVTEEGDRNATIRRLVISTIEE